MPETVKRNVVREVYARPLMIPYPDVRKFGANAIAHGEHVFVRVVTEDGLEGLGEAVSRPYLYGESIPSIMHALKAWLSPAIVGESAFDTDLAWKRWGAFAGNHSAKSALDMALFDIQAKAVGVPLWKWCGGLDPVVPLGWILTYGSVEDVVAEGKKRVAEGFRWFKVKVSDNAQLDRAVLEGLRKELPDDCHFYGDANGIMSRGTALARINELHALGVAFIEDPIDAADLAGKRELQAMSPLPISADESAKTLRECGQEVLSGGVDIFSIKIFRTGLTVSRDIVALALALNRQCAIGGQGETHLGAAISAHFSSALRESGCAPYPAETSTSYRYDFNLLGKRPEFRDGKMVLSAEPGLGVELDLDVVKKLSKGTDDPSGNWIRLV